MENEDLTAKISAAKQLYAVQSYDECSSLIQVRFNHLQILKDGEEMAKNDGKCSHFPVHFQTCRNRFEITKILKTESASFSVLLFSAKAEVTQFLKDFHQTKSFSGVSNEFFPSFSRKLRSFFRILGLS